MRSAGDYGTQEKLMAGVGKGAILSVLCPTCGAGVGLSCVSQSGIPTTAHEYRRRRVIRNANQSRVGGVSVEFPVMMLVRGQYRHLLHGDGKMTLCGIGTPMLSISVERRRVVPGTFGEANCRGCRAGLDSGLDAMGVP